jgi:hypothetical protein
VAVNEMFEWVLVLQPEGNTCSVASGWILRCHVLGDAIAAAWIQEMLRLIGVCKRANKGI